MTKASKTKADNLREKSNEELEVLFGDNQKEIFALRNAAANSDKQATPHQRIEKKRENARIQTILTERKRAHAKE